MRYRLADKTVYSAKYHLIWCPKDRGRVLVDGVAERLKAVIAEVAAEVGAAVGAAVIEVEVLRDHVPDHVPDHVQLLAEVPPTVPLSKFVGLLKGRSSRRLRRHLPRLRRLPARWRRSWCVATVGGAPSAVVRRCVENQKAASGR
jgi:putative transposase